SRRTRLSYASSDTHSRSSPGMRGRTGLSGSGSGSCRNTNRSKWEQLLKVIALTSPSAINRFLNMLFPFGFRQLIRGFSFMPLVYPGLRILRSTLGLLSTLLRYPLLPGNYTQRHVHHTEQSAKDRHHVGF